MMVLPKPKHVATLLKQSNYSNYSVVMSNCLSLIIFPHLTIYSAVRLTTAVCHAMLRRFVKISRRFEWWQSHHLIGQSIKERCTLQRLKSLRQKLRIYGTRVPNDRRKCFLGTRLSLLSLNCFDSFCSTSLYIVKCARTRAHTHTYDL